MGTVVEATSSYPLSEVIGALSHALDLTEGQPVGHCPARLHDRHGAGRAARPARRTCAGRSSTPCCSRTPGARAAPPAWPSSSTPTTAPLKRDFKRINWTSTADFIRFAARHVAPGVAGLARAAQLLRALRTHRREARRSTRPAATAAPGIVAMLGFPAATAAAVRALDEHWDGSGTPGRARRARRSRSLARIACLAQTAEVFCTPTARRRPATWCASARGTLVRPRLADAFLAIGRRRPAVAAAGERRPRPRCCATSSRARPSAWPTRTGSTASPRPSRASSTPSRRTPRATRRGVATYRRRRSASSSGSTPARLRDAAPRRPAARHRQARRLQPHPRQARQARRRRVRGDAPPPALHAARSCAASRPSRDSPSAPPRTTSGSTAGLPPRPERRTTFARWPRILAVADVFEALTAERPYRGPCRPTRCSAIMRRDAGTALDPGPRGPAGGLRRAGRGALGRRRHRGMPGPGSGRAGEGRPRARRRGQAGGGHGGARAGLGSPGAGVGAGRRGGAASTRAARSIPTPSPLSTYTNTAHGAPGRSRPARRGRARR